MYSKMNSEKRLLDVVRDITYLVYGYEPSTGFEWFKGAFTKHEIQKAAESLVDDVTRTQGWVYKKEGLAYQPFAYASLAGDGGVDYHIL